MMIIPNNVKPKLKRVKGCLAYTGKIRPDGYVRVRYKGKLYYLHRLIWELNNGPVADGLELDHLCKTRHCTDLTHLEEVTHKENCLRSSAGEKARERAAAITHCPKGHSYSGSNLYVDPNGSRRCRSCARTYLRNWNKEKML